MNFPFGAELNLENNFALLRPIDRADFDHLLPIAVEDKDLLQFSPKQIHSPHHLQLYIESAIQKREANERYSFSVYDKSTNQYAGSTSFLNISNEDNRLEIGATWYGRAFQRTGLNRNCKFLLLEYAFDRLGALRVEFRSDERNIPSRRAIEAIGGKFEGILRSHMLMSDGFRRNTVCYSILFQEWLQMKPDFLSKSTLS